MIPFGPCRPDIASTNVAAVRMALNCLPDSKGFKPLPGLNAGTDALASEVRGAGVAINISDGSGSAFAGTETALYKLDANSNWQDVSRLSGGAYSTASGERWKFEQYGNRVIATNGTDAIQKFDLGTDTNFSALAGSPPLAKHIATTRDAIILANIVGNENRVVTSGLNNSEQWTAGTNSSIIQDFPTGGPIQGLIGGENPFIFQRNNVIRMTFAPGTAEIYQFNEVEGGKGLIAPNSLVPIGKQDYLYLSTDGFYKFNTIAGGSVPIGAEKVDETFLNDMRSGTEISVLGQADPVRKLVKWAYISGSNGGTIPDKVIIYDWSIGEFSFANLDVEAFVNFTSAGYTLEQLDAFGTVENLPFSLDSAFWSGGQQSLGLFSTDHTLSLLSGDNLQAEITTNDWAESNTRLFLSGIQPFVDADSVNIAAHGRERFSEAVDLSTYEGIEIDGTVPAHVSGKVLRAKIQIPAAQDWTLAQGFAPIYQGAGAI